MIVPFAAGGPTDTYARIVAEQLSTIWGQQVVIDNKGGAGSNIGNAFVAHSGPDGYTLLFGTSSLASNGALYRSLDYSPTTDLTPISLVARFLLLLSRAAKQHDCSVHPRKKSPGGIPPAGAL